MGGLPSAYLFLLGLASGLTLLSLTAYRRMSPRWLKWLLVVTGCFTLSRYVTMALFASSPDPQRVWFLRPCYFATSIGLPLPSVLAIDQLLRHPAMSPKKLLRWCSPFLIASLAAIFLSASAPVPDRVLGWTPHLSSGWRWWFACIHGGFFLAFVGMILAIWPKVPWPRVRLALLGLLLGHSALGLDGLLRLFGAWYFRPFLYSEMLTLLAIWYAYETSVELQQASA